MQRIVAKGCIGRRGRGTWKVPIERAEARACEIGAHTRRDERREKNLPSIHLVKLHFEPEGKRATREGRLVSDIFFFFSCWGLAAIISYSDSFLSKAS